MLALFLFGALTACAPIPSTVSDYDETTSSVELTGTPFYSQERYQCGPAALLTVLDQSGVAASLGELTDRVYLPGREGSLQTELLAATRAKGRVPYLVDGRIAALAAELQAGRSVLVLQNLGVRLIPRWHYAVAVGIDTVADTVVLRSGTEPRRITPRRTFLRTWRRSQYWGMVVLRPGELPADPQSRRYFEAVAALEQTGHVVEARRSWQAARRQWPHSPVAQFGLANSEFMLENWQAAEAAYRQLLVEYPDLLMARNNLALSLLRQRRHESARLEAEAALRDADENTPLREELRRTLAEIDAASP